jgi:hypothetical protein
VGNGTNLQQYVHGTGVWLSIIMASKGDWTCYSDGKTVALLVLHALKVVENPEGWSCKGWMDSTY